MTFEEMAWEFAEVFDDLDIDQVNEMLARNVPIDTLKFFTQYADDFSRNSEIDPKTRGRLPNLMLIGYLICLLEDRLRPDAD